MVYFYTSLVKLKIFNLDTCRLSKTRNSECMENTYSWYVLGKHLHAPSIFESHKNASMVIDSQKISIHQRWVWHIIWIKKHPTFYSHNYKWMVGKYFASRERIYFSVLRIFYHESKPSFHLNRYAWLDKNPFHLKYYIAEMTSVLSRFLS